MTNPNIPNKHNYPTIFLIILWKFVYPKFYQNTSDGEGAWENYNVCPWYTK